MLFRSIAREASRLLSRSDPQAAPPQVERRHGSWHHDDLEWLAGMVHDVPGDFAEIGVFRGAAFRKVAALATLQGRTAHAFDSFCGMDAPGTADGTDYPKGRFDIGGKAEFVRLMTEAGVPRDAYQVWAGYVPACFAQAPAALQLSLAILDLDHYRPSVEALTWLAPRISRGGLLALDDFVPPHNMLATRAINEFLAVDTQFERVACFNQQLILRRQVSSPPGGTQS